MPASPTLSAATRPPERILQFGTGVLLRGLCDYAIDAGNRQGLYNGSVVMVKSTASGSIDAFVRQGGQYTLCMRGQSAGRTVDEAVRISAISRVVEAQNDWTALLDLAEIPDLEIVISNTTELGLRLDPADDLTASPPASFPAKLLALLLRRYQKFGNDASKGWVILPTELVQDNGAVLRELVTTLAQKSDLRADFLDWLDQANHFCNTLVDRIVPGQPTAEVQAQLTQRLGCQDELLIVSEPYLLWAIAADERVAARLGFARALPGVVVQPDIEVFRTLKLYLLNGLHTAACALAHLAGLDTVYVATQDPEFRRLLEQILFEELLPALPDGVDESQARTFAAQVLDRFGNPFLAHHWLDISFQYTTKWLHRCQPLLENYSAKFGHYPPGLLLGMAAFFRFARAEGQNAAGFYGIANGRPYPLRDELAAIWRAHWALPTVAETVKAALKDTQLWQGRTLDLPGLAEALVALVENLSQHDLALENIEIPYQF
ncbi:tagaturonate reductase [Neolewinella lacunae]|uniref:Tagaturonate reductase n=1 Tax=Neolewinella lacunae TaxID=1517758 RepID=A0A923PM25_9BACT|nr:tagaturonate reductase [Neolewinella lacunae]MBC6995211.1 tagaturonate reductase [Neolewinella lacunae]MDN3635480.1 tagaturonate reductase [Neolewinella lacunae]